MRTLPLFALLVGCPPEKHEQLDKPDAFPAAEVIPAPRVLTPAEGGYALSERTGIAAGAGAETVAEALAGWLRPATGFPLPVGEAGAISLSLTSGIEPEGYALDVTEAGVALTASDEAGLFYGAQTLRQLMRGELFTGAAARRWAIGAVHIEDGPRFPARGLMLDVARHFFTVAEVKRQIDLMAVYKLNRLHLHLTDDQGWRLEILSWPDLTEVGGSTAVGGGAGGFYTQADFAELVAYAAERHITVVPEIDMPGHMHAALASYGELNADGVPQELYTGAGVISTPLCLDCPATVVFVEDVITELAAISPGAELHIGGDEAVDIEAADYAAFVVDVQEIVEANGKVLVGWDEIGNAPLSGDFVVQQWWHEDQARAATDAGGRLISSPAAHAYFDMKYTVGASYGQTWAGLVDVQTAYEWDPVLTGVAAAQVDGVEGALWTEYIDSEARMDFMLWPRAIALSELGWSEATDWDDFSARLATHGPRLTGLGVGFYASNEIEWEESVVSP